MSIAGRRWIDRSRTGYRYVSAEPCYATRWASLRAAGSARRRNAGPHFFRNESG